MYYYIASLIRIVDGDTVIAMVDLGFSTWKKVTIRLYGIDTPETRTKDLEEKEKGLAAKERLSQLLRYADFELESIGVDKYGRCLGVLRIGELNINKTLLSEGHAMEYYG